jgi:hypothetical protein
MHYTFLNGIMPVVVKG